MSRELARTFGGMSSARSGMCRSPITKIRKAIAKEGSVLLRGNRYEKAGARAMKRLVRQAILGSAQ
jgi:hypothetical protein